jgi:hypothetical protein
MRAAHNWRASALTAALLATIAIPAANARYVRADLGGSLHTYAGMVEAARFSGERVRIDGICASACTLYLNLPPSQICATPRAVFIFHTATDAMLGLPSWQGNETLYQAYPDHVRIAIGRRGGLWLTPIRIKGTALVPGCR